MLTTLKSLLWTIMALLTAVIMCFESLVEAALQLLAGESKLFYIYEKYTSSLYISMLMQLAYMCPDKEVKDKVTALADALVREWHEDFDD